MFESIRGSVGKENRDCDIKREEGLFKSNVRVSLPKEEREGDIEEVLHHFRDWV